MHLLFKDKAVVVQSLSLSDSFATPWTAAHQASLSFIISWSLLKLMSIDDAIMMSNGDAIQPFHLLSSPSPPALNFLQHQGLFK